MRPAARTNEHDTKQSYKVLDGVYDDSITGFGCFEDCSGW